MDSNPQQIVAKLWNYCNILRDDGLSYGDYVEQLNFLQHVYTLLKQHGRAAIVVPDNVLFEGGAGEVIRRKLLHECEVHTLLRLPTGIFYAQGVKANVLFFDRKPAAEKAWTSKLWIYDLRTNQHFTLKENPLQRADLDDFVACYRPSNRHERAESERFHAFAYDELVKRDKANLDIFWLRDSSLEDSANLPGPDVIAPRSSRTSRPPSSSSPPSPRISRSDGAGCSGRGVAALRRRTVSGRDVRRGSRRS